MSGLAASLAKRGDGPGSPLRSLIPEGILASSFALESDNQSLGFQLQCLV